MPKYLLLKHYRGGPEPYRAVPPLDEWDPADMEAHLTLQRNVDGWLQKNDGSVVDVQALTPARTWVRYGGPDAAPVITDGPLPETSDLVAGWFMVDAESHQHAVEFAAYVSSEPGPGGTPLYEWIDVREETTFAEPAPTDTDEGDDTLFLLFCCCHPDLTPASQVALTLRAVGGLSTREIADAFYVPEATMAQRISRAKRTLHGARLDQPGDLAVVLRVLYLVYSAGHGGRIDVAGEAIRLARQLTLATAEPEAHGLLALILLNHARLPARLDAEGRIGRRDRLAA